MEADFGPRPTDRVLVFTKGRTHKVWVPLVRRWRWHGMVDGKAVGWWQTVVPEHRKDAPGVWMKTWEAWAWDEEVDRLVRETAISRANWHPLQRRGHAGSRKKSERVMSNRYDRRRARADLRDKDYDNVRTDLDPFNWRSVY